MKGPGDGSTFRCKTGVGEGGEQPLPPRENNRSTWPFTKDRELFPAERSE